MAKEVVLNDVEKKCVFDFASQTAHTHYSRGRNLEKLKNNVIQGKIGEVGFYLMFREYLENFPDLTRTMKGDEGYDFILNHRGNKMKIDVKTIRMNSNRFYFNPKNSSRCDYFAVVETDGHKVKYLGKISSKQAIDNCDQFNNEDGSKSHSVRINKLD